MTTFKNAIFGDVVLGARSTETEIARGRFLISGARLRALRNEAIRPNNESLEPKNELLEVVK